MGADKEFGFSLLELMITSALAALVMATLLLSLLQFNQHKEVAQSLVQIQTNSQIATAQLLIDWQSLCGSEVISGGNNRIKLMRAHQSQCTQYTYAHNASNNNITRQKSGGIRSGFVSQVASLKLYFGVDTDQDCRIDQWQNSYSRLLTHKLHQVRVELLIMAKATHQLSLLEGSVWQLHDVSIDNHTLHPVSFIWRVSDDCD